MEIVTLRLYAAAGWTRRRGMAAIGAALLLACSPDTSGNLDISAPLQAKGGSGSGGGTAEVLVTAASPSQAQQDTTLNVTISGSGFGTGARAVWSLNGDTTQVVVKSTKVVSATQVIATVAVPLSASVSSYDVIVVMPGGKKGVGAEMFIVTQKDPNLNVTLSSDAGLGVTSDGYSLSYNHGVCGINGRLFATIGASGSGDVILDGDNPKYKDVKCKGYPRKFSINYGDGIVQLANAGISVQMVENGSFQIPVGITVKRGLNLSDTRCTGLRWKAQLHDGTPIPGDSVNVTRVDASTWVVESQPAPNNRAYCIASGKTYNIAVKFTVVSTALMP